MYGVELYYQCSSQPYCFSGLIYAMTNPSSPNSQERNRTLYFGLDIPFLDHLGVVPESAEEGKVRISYTVQPEHTNSFHVAQGGLIMTLLDFAMGAAARTASNHPLGAITIDMTTSFLRPSLGKIVVEGTLLKAGKSINYCEAVALNEAGEITAKSTGTFMLRK